MYYVHTYKYARMTPCKKKKKKESQTLKVSIIQEVEHEVYLSSYVPNLHKYLSAHG